MIKGIGTDIIEIARVEKATQRPGFLERYFTEGERALYEKKGSKAEFLAANFAAKEAIVKAMGTGFMGFHPGDMEILRDGRHAPIFIPYGPCKSRLEKLGIETIHLSVSHNQEMATAFAIAEGNESYESGDSQGNALDG